MASYDVAVIGGGPVGSYAACRLAGMGHGVVVLEAKTGPGVCCTGLVGLECVAAFAVDDALILRRASSARLFSPSGKALRLWRREPQAAVLDRAAFDAAMVSRAQGAGAEYRLGCRVSGISPEGDGVRVEAVSGGERLEVRARAAVIAAGFGSALAEGLGLGQPRDSITGAQAEVATAGIDEVEVYFGRDVAPGFFAWLVPVSPQRARVGLLSRLSPRHYLEKLMSRLAAEGKLVSSEVEAGYGGVWLRPLPRTYGERVVVVGGAAGQVKPTTAGGIYYGLLCADIAAASLHRALVKDDLSARVLAGYERGWRRRLGGELRRGYWARRFYERLSDQQLERIFDIVKSGGLDRALLEEEDLSFDWHAGALLKLLAHRAVAGAVAGIKVPFRAGPG